MVANPIIYRLVPSPLRFETRQLRCKADGRLVQTTFLQQTITRYKIRHAGGQDSRAGTLKQRPVKLDWLRRRIDWSICFNVPVRE